MSLCAQAYRAACELLLEEAARRAMAKHEALPEPQAKDHRSIAKAKLADK
jgi:hypothetical protein